jgi:hypothetical protein
MPQGSDQYRDRCCLRAHGLFVQEADINFAHDKAMRDTKLGCMDGAREPRARLNFYWLLFIRRFALYPTKSKPAALPLGYAPT